MEMPGEVPNADDEYLLEELGPDLYNQYQRMTPEQQQQFMNDPANGFAAPDLDGLFDEHMRIEDELMHIEPDSASRPMLEQRWRELDELFKQTVPNYQSSPPPVYQPQI
jgi:hypothetical protein